MTSLCNLFFPNNLSYPFSDPVSSALLSSVSLVIVDCLCVLTVLLHNFLFFTYPCFSFSCFKMNVDSIFISVVQCPAYEVRFDSTGEILSPGYPENYSNLQTCSWLINVEKGYNITLNFELFETEKEFDILEIFDGM